MDLIKNVLEVDEEGFPLFSGIRVDDADLLREIFSNVNYLYPENPRSGLWTVVGGTPAILSSFSQPFVAQDIVPMDRARARWVFPGGLSWVVPHDRLRIDPWNRLQTLVFDKEFPATARRSAQAQFLLSHDGPEDVRPYYAVSSDQRGPEFWSLRYQDHDTPWDLLACTPVLTREWDGFWKRFPISSALVLGAGGGHDAEFLRARGLDVAAIDFSGAAMSLATKTYPKLVYEEADAWDYLGSRTSSIESIFEHTMFCVVPPLERRQYLTAIHKALRPGGLYFGVFWMKHRPVGPPFGLTQWELRELSSDLFDVHAWHLSLDSVAERRGQEFWIVLQKRVSGS